MPDLIPEKLIECVVVLPAAGTGQRFGSEKQFEVVCGKPILLHTLQAFFNLNQSIYIKFLIICVQEKNIDLVNNLVKQTLPPQNVERVRVIKGDHTRHRSIRQGIQYLHTLEVENSTLVIVHDVVRPLLSNNLVYQLLQMAYKYQAAGPVCGLASTVFKTNEKGFLETALVRSAYRASEMPQVAQLYLLSSAYAKCEEVDLDHGTDCLELIRKYESLQAKCIESNSDILFKVTYPRDIYSLKGKLAEQSTISLLNAENWIENQKKLENNINLKSDIEVIIHKDIKTLILMNETISKDWTFHAHVLLYTKDEKMFQMIKELKNLSKNITKNQKKIYIICKDELDASKIDALKSKLRVFYQESSQINNLIVFL